MIVIADGGSTKTNWCLINEAGRKIYFNTEGYNPYFSKGEYIVKSLNETLPDHLEREKLTAVYSKSTDTLPKRTDVTDAYLFESCETPHVALENGVKYNIVVG